MSKGFIWSLGVVALLAIGAYFLVAHITSETPEVIACTADAMQCPDGSYVGRTGPTCEFVCPTTSDATSTQVSAQIGKRAVGLRGISILPLQLLEDSRCPLDVQCIQAGTVRVTAELVDGLGTSTETFALGKPITAEAVVVTLVDVLPAPISKATKKPSDYTFIFSIERR